MFNYYELALKYKQVAQKNEKAQKDVIFRISLYPLEEIVLFCGEVGGELQKEDLDTLVKKICQKGNAKYIYELAVNAKLLSKDNINDLTEAMCKTKEAQYIYLFALIVEPLSKANINDLTEVMCKTREAQYIYLFALNVKSLNEDNINTLIDVLIALDDMKYIIYAAIYIDNSLISELFKTINSLYKYIETSGLFSDDELNSIKKSMYEDKTINQEINLEHGKNK